MSVGKKTVGFGVPDEVDPHHFTVVIPAARGDDVVVTENFGLSGGSNGLPDAVERCRLPRVAWTAIADELKRVLNERLKEKGLGTSRWSSGTNRVERLLGREICVLAWSVEAAPLALVSTGIRSWGALKPEERWWLFSMAASLTGTSADTDIGWRKALRVALTETPSTEGTAPIRKKRPRGHSEADRPQLPFFDKA